MTSRRLRVLIQHLPPESHTMTALRNELTDEELSDEAEAGEPEKGRWSQAEQLLASIVDATRRVEHVLTCANSEGKNPPWPEPMRRPGAKPRAAKKASEPLNEERADTLFALING